jgi:dienelactone hydrolase
LALEIIEAEIRSRIVARAQASPHALPGKTVVIGFSQGGGVALVQAADMPEVISAVVAYYAQTNFVADASLIARRFQVPVLILAGSAIPITIAA